MPKNKTRVTIAGTSYTVCSEEKEEYILSVADAVDSKIQEVRRSNIDVSDLMAAILTAMDFCDTFRKTTKEVNSLRDELNKNMEYLTEAQISLERLKEENNMFKNKIADLERKLRYKKH